MVLERISTLLVPPIARAAAVGVDGGSGDAAIYEAAKFGTRSNRICWRRLMRAAQ